MYTCKNNFVMLFEQTMPKDDSPLQPNINITYLQLYYSEDEHKLFKELCIKGMMRMYPTDYRERNMSDYILELLKLYNK